MVWAEERRKSLDNALETEAAYPSLHKRQVRDGHNISRQTFECCNAIAGGMAIGLIA